MAMASNALGGERIAVAVPLGEPAACQPACLCLPAASARARQEQGSLQFAAAAARAENWKRFTVRRQNKQNMPCFSPLLQLSRARAPWPGNGWVLGSRKLPFFSLLT
jgi:hypothetical protein